MPCGIGIDMRYKYFIHDIPSTLNAYLGRKNVWKYRAEKKRFDEILGLIILANGKPEKPIKKANVFIRYKFPDNRRRDADNFCGKVLVDPLVKHGIITDDSFKCIKLFVDGEFNCKEPGVLIVVEEQYV